MNKNHSPEGLFAYARQYKVAADIILQHQNKEALVPAIFLLTHSLELALKSYLLSAKVSEKELSRHPYHHDVAYCFSAAETRGAFGQRALSPAQRETIAVASELFKDKELSYLYEKEAKLPDAETLHEALNSILHSVFDRVSEPYFLQMRDA